MSEETASPKEVREHLKKQIPKLFKAVAFISDTPVGTMVGTITSVLAPSHLPTKVCKTEKEAREWLEEYLHKC